MSVSSEDSNTLRICDSRESVKRSLSPTPDGPAKKRAHVDGTEQLSVKILVPTVAVGAIIGKGGDVMRALKADHNCAVHMSKNGDTYPGTSERLCTIKGRFHNVKAVISEITEKINEKCGDAMGTDIYDFKDTSRGLEVKLAIPNSSAGIVIGKAGMTIKDIKERTHCQIQVLPKSGTNEAIKSKERIVVMAHNDTDSLMDTVERVLERVAADPHHGSEINREESKTSKFVPPHSPSSAFYASSSSVPMSPVGNTQMPPPNVNTQIHPGMCIGNHEVLSFLDNLQQVLRDSGFNEPSVGEIMGAMQVLAKYNVMAVGLGFGVQAMVQMRAQQQAQQQQRMATATMNYPTNHGSAGFGAAHHQLQQQQYTTSDYWRRNT